ncbi:hypothetical protein SOVF_006920 isoform A [Spinacia oleracea]|nr:hypothetical protein SOVF_006920 isoform A [Spinacia oleracea]
MLLLRLIYRAVCKAVLDYEKQQIFYSDLMRRWTYQSCYHWSKCIMHRRSVDEVGDDSLFLFHLIKPILYRDAVESQGRRGSSNRQK